MRLIGLAVVLTVSLTFAPPSVIADDEVTLFDSRREATAYIALDDELIVYLWTGKPIAYLDPDSEGGFHVYGFNGKHLGWFVGGVLRDHEGNAACAVKERFRTTNIEPLKALKQLKLLKGLQELAPLRPLFTTSWGDAPCRFFLAVGG
jgi:hypothetical protein